MYLEKYPQYQEYREFLNVEYSELRIFNAKSMLTPEDKKLVFNNEIQGLTSISKFDLGSTISGYFDMEHNEDLWKSARGLSGKVRGIYITLNSVNPQLMDRAFNRLNWQCKYSTDDANIAKVSVFPIDIDCENPAGTSATLEQVNEKRIILDEILSVLEKAEVPYGYGPSGNGWHILVPIEPEDPTCSEEIHEILKGLHHRYPAVDEGVYNPARVWKLPLTKVCKGDIKELHRLARFKIPIHYKRINLANLKDIMLSEYPQPEEKRIHRYNGGYQGERISLEEFLRKHGVEHGPGTPYKGSTRYQLDCPFNESHKSPDAFVCESGQGWSFHCSHNSCRGKKWRDFRNLVAPKPTFQDRRKRHQEAAELALKALSI